MGTWEVCLSNTGKPCDEPGVFPVASALAATDLEMTRSNTFIARITIPMCLVLDQSA